MHFNGYLSKILKDLQDIVILIILARKTMIRFLTIGVLLVQGAVFFHLPAQDLNSKLTPGLVRAIGDLEEGKTLSIWITLTDKGPSLAAKHDEAQGRLSERALRRRSKMRSQSDLITFKDYSLEDTYVQRVQNIVTRLRQTSRWFNALSVEATASQIRELAALPFVSRIDPVMKLRRSDHWSERSSGESVSPKTSIMDTLNYGTSYTQVAQINVPAVHQSGNHGEGIMVAVFDAGFNNLTHPAFSTMDIVATHDFVNGDSSVGDDGDMGEGSHGTNTLSVIGGYAPGQLIGPAFGASYVLAKTENTDSETPVEEDNWIAAVEWAEGYGVDLISCSLGYIGFDGQTYYNWTWMNGDSCRITIAADMATWEGIVVVNSAGNEGDNSAHNTLGAPADGDTVIAAGAVNSGGTRVSFSSVGPTVDGRIKPDVMAMGSGVKAAFGSPGATGYESVSGTSFSCPLTAGVCALILSANPSLTPYQVREALRTTASNAGAPNKYYGWGIVDAFDAVHYYSAVISHVPLSDTEDETGPYTVTATITSLMPLVADSIRLVYGSAGALTNSVLMTPTGTPNVYSADIPSQGPNANIQYYIRVVNNFGIQTTLPSDAPVSYFSFHAGVDTVLPVIIHSPLGDQGLDFWPAEVAADVTDNLGVDSVLIEFRVNGIEQAPFVLAKDSLTNTYRGSFPQVVLALNDSIEYRVRAVDGAVGHNQSFDPATGYWVFHIGSFTSFSDNLNATDGGFQGTMDWEWGTPSGAGAPAPHSSPNLWATNLQGNYSDDMLATLTLPEMMVASGGASFSFWHVYDTENAWDGGNVKASVNGGPFQVITPVGGYPLASLNTGNPLAGQPGFSGTSMTWQQKTFNLAGIAQAGDNIVIRFDFGTDGSVTDLGWYVDDFSAVDVGSILVDADDAGKGASSKIFSLDQNYPNPFNPSTTIRFTMGQPGLVTIRIYNVLGQEVRRLLNDSRRTAGTHHITWDGRDGGGHSVSSGIYWYRMTTASGWSMSRRMLLLK